MAMPVAIALAAVWLSIALSCRTNWPLGFFAGVAGAVFTYAPRPKGAANPQRTLDTSVSEPDPEQPGYSRRVRSKTVAEVFAEIVSETPVGAEEYFKIGAIVPPDLPWPDQNGCRTVRGAGSGPIGLYDPRAPVSSAIKTGLQPSRRLSGVDDAIVGPASLSPRRTQIRH